VKITSTLFALWEVNTINISNLGTDGLNSALPPLKIGPINFSIVVVMPKFGVHCTEFLSVGVTLTAVWCPKLSNSLDTNIQYTATPNPVSAPKRLARVPGYGSCLASCACPHKLDCIQSILLHQNPFIP